MTAKLRVYEVARDLGMDQKALVSLLQSSGVPDVRNHMSSIGADVVERIRRQLEKQKAPSVVEARDARRARVFVDASSASGARGGMKLPTNLNRQ